MASAIAYAQCWEDADVLVQALDPRPGMACLSIASAGDNTLALLAKSPARVVALDMNPAQLACLELRVAGYRELSHPELLELLGSAPSTRRAGLYRRCRPLLSAEARAFWDARPDDIDNGIGAAGRFERYLATFRRRVLPLIHSHDDIAQLLSGGSREERERFYDSTWDTFLWRAVFRIFFSRAVMSLSGRNPAYFRYARGSIAEHLLARVRYACTVLEPARNPYLHWIMTGRHAETLPFALRAENFDAIRANLDRLEWRCMRLEEFLAQTGGERFDRCNLSDAFEYMAPDAYARTLEALVRASRPGCRLAYWNLLVPRQRPEWLRLLLRPLARRAAGLFAADKAFFYSNFVLEEVA